MSTPQLVVTAVVLQRRNNHRQACPASRGSCARSFQAGRRDARSPSSRILRPGAMVPKHQILNEVTVPHSLERQGN
jgi:hypothetical protein